MTNGTSIKFEVDVTSNDSHTGVLLFVFDADNEPDEGDESVCYYLVFEGKRDLDEVAQLFCAAHDQAMTSVNLSGEVTEEEFVTRLEDSIELAGQLMIRHGLKNIDTDDIPEDLMQSLFLTPEEETDPSKLN